MEAEDGSRRAGGGNAPSAAGRRVRRYGEKAIKGLLAACGALSVLTTTAIVFSLLGPTVGFFEIVPAERVLLRDRLDAAVRAAQLRRAADRRRHPQRDPLGDAVRDPDRPRRRRLPQRVRQPPGPQDGQAGARDPRRHPHGRDRLLRRSPSSCPRSSSRSGPASSSAAPSASRSWLLLAASASA